MEAVAPIRSRGVGGWEGVEGEGAGAARPPGPALAPDNRADTHAGREGRKIGVQKGRVPTRNWLADTYATPQPNTIH